MARVCIDTLRGFRVGANWATQVKSAIRKSTCVSHSHVNMVHALTWGCLFGAVVILVTVDVSAIKLKPANLDPVNVVIVFLQAIRSLVRAQRTTQVVIVRIRLIRVN